MKGPLPDFGPERLQDDPSGSGYRAISGQFPDPCAIDCLDRRQRVQIHRAAVLAIARLCGLLQRLFLSPGLAHCTFPLRFS